MDSTKRIVKKAILRTRLLQTVSRVLPRGVAILRYHSVEPEPARFATTIGSGIIHSASVFAAQMEWIARGFRPITLDEILALGASGRKLPRRAVAITFDDGFRDNFEVAAPILARYSLRAAFYVTVGCIGTAEPPWFARLRYAFHAGSATQWVEPATGRAWDLSDTGRRNEAFLSACRFCACVVGEHQRSLVESIEAALDGGPFPCSDRLMMDWSQVRALHEAGHAIGSHTMTHPNLAHVSIGEMRHELEESRRILERELAAPVIHFSYPSPILEPHWTGQTVDLTRDLGYRTAVTCTPGPARGGRHLLSLPRVAVPTETSEFLWTLEATLAGRRV